MKSVAGARISSALRLSRGPMLVIMMILIAHQLIIAIDCDQFQHQYQVSGDEGPRSNGSLASHEGQRQNRSHQLSEYIDKPAADALVTGRSPTLNPTEAREDANSRYANKAIELSLRRMRRFTRSRGKTGRIMLAQRPTKTTTTTSSTTTTTNAPGQPEKSKTAQAESDEAEVEESGDSGDYEELESSRKQPKSTTPTVESSDGIEEDGAEEDGEDETTVTTETTTTTQRATTTTRRTSGARKGTAARNRPTTRAPTRPEELEEEKEEEEAELEKATRKKVKTNEAPIGKNDSRDVSSEQLNQHHRKKPLVALPFIRAKNISICTPEAYLEFPRDLIGEKWRGRGLILVHVFVVCYMFYALALVCERYFMPSLEEFAQRLEISEDVAGATLMSAGSSAPELFTAILGVFVAKGDVGTGAIVGSAVFNILFVIGVCAFVSTTTAQLQWWPVLRDSVYYTFTVLVLILIIYDERITALESASMIALYGVYIAIMVHNEQLKELVTRNLMSHPVTAKLISSQSMAVDGPDDVFGGQPLNQVGANLNASTTTRSITMHNKRVEDDSIWLAALLLVVRHKRLFRSNLRFQSAARYIITKRQHKQAYQMEASRGRGKQHEEVNYFGPEGGADTPLNGTRSESGQRARIEAYARSSTLSKNKFSIVSKEDYEFW